MLIYHPVSDANHCAYRIISFLYGIEDQELSVDSLRFLDFYYLFPYQLKYIKPMPQGFGEFRKDINILDEQYEDIINPKRIFFELTEVQNNTLIFLISKGVISKSRYENKFVKLNIDMVPERIVQRINSDEFRKSRVFELLTTKFLKLELNGNSGIKKRSGLMEYIYD